MLKCLLTMVFIINIYMIILNAVVSQRLKNKHHDEKKHLIRYEFMTNV